MPAQTGSLCFDGVSRTEVGRAGRHDRRAAHCGDRPRPLGGPDGRYRARPAQHRAAPAGLHVRQRSGALDVRPRRADPRSLSRRRSHPCRRHAAGLCLALFQQDAAAGTGRDHRPVPRHRDCRAAARRQHLSARRHQGGRRPGGAPHPRALSGAQDRRIQQRLFPPRRRRGADHRRYQSCPGRTFSGSASARRPSNRSPRAIATSCMASD